MNSANILKKLQEASFAYHNGFPETMSDDEYDALLEQLRDLEPKHSFLSTVGAAVVTGDEVDLPIPLPSLNKVKPDGTLQKWVARNSATEYAISAKLDGCSALWLPQAGKLYTRGDGMRGRDISGFAKAFQGLIRLPESSPIRAIRGELILRTDSKQIPTGKLARNIVAGALNRQDVDPVLFGEIRFIAYELIQPGNLVPTVAFRELKNAGYETARTSTLKAAEMTESHLSELFSSAEAVSPYQMDGIVVAPNVARPGEGGTEIKRGQAVNPADRVAWKTRQTAATRRTVVRAVEWNISHQRNMIPRVLFDTVELQGAKISVATGLHGRWIFENGVGPGSEIEIRRAGDTIPQIIAVHTRAIAGPAMPAKFVWDGQADSAIHIKPAEGEGEQETTLIRLTHALNELGAENVGPGLVAKLYEAGFTTLRAIYAASAADFEAKVDGCKQKMAERIWIGVRVKQDDWKEIHLMCASCTMPRGVSHTKLQPLLEMEPNPALWSIAGFHGKRPAGLSDKTIEAIVEAIPEYLNWRNYNFPGRRMQTKEVVAAAVAAPRSISGKVVVFTGFRNKAMEEALVAKGHEIGASVNKKTTHVIHANGADTNTVKITKARDLGITILSEDECRAAFHV